MLGITPFGMFHTVIALVAVAAGITALVRHGQIDTRHASGSLYFWMTVATCVTGFFIFHHGGFGKAHALGIITLIALAVAYAAERGKGFGRASRYVATLTYSLTLFFHMIPAITETATRVPPGQPLAAGPEAAGIQAAVGVAFIVYLLIAAWQVRRLRAAPVGLAGTPGLGR